MKNIIILLILLIPTISCTNKTKATPEKYCVISEDISKCSDQIKIEAGRIKEPNCAKVKDLIKDCVVKKDETATVKTEETVSCKYDYSNCPDDVQTELNVYASDGKMTNDKCESIKTEVANKCKSCNDELKSYESATVCDEIKDDIKLLTRDYDKLKEAARTECTSEVMKNINLISLNIETYLKRCEKPLNLCDLDGVPNQEVFYFDNGEDKLNEENQKKLDEFVKCLSTEAKKDNIIYIEGYASRSSIYEWNYSLSLSRANLIVNLLKDKKTEIIPFGESKTTGEDSKDRKVIIYVK